VKTIATIWTMCVPVWTLSFIRQVVHSTFNRPDFSLHGPEAQASFMEITCISLTVWTPAFMVRTLQALIWKLSAAKVQPSGRSSFIYGNYVHQFNRLDASLHGPDAPSLDMEIECS